VFIFALMTAALNLTWTKADDLCTKS